MCVSAFGGWLYHMELSTFGTRPVLPFWGAASPQAPSVGVSVRPLKAQTHISLFSWIVVIVSASLTNRMRHCKYECHTINKACVHICLISVMLTAYYKADSMNVLFLRHLSVCQLDLFLTKLKQFHLGLWVPSFFVTSFMANQVIQLWSQDLHCLFFSKSELTFQYARGSNGGRYQFYSGNVSTHWLLTLVIS